MLLIFILFFYASSLYDVILSSLVWLHAWVTIQMETMGRINFKLLDIGK